MTVLNDLINKQDTSEIVRDQIAALLAAEFTNQQALATAAALDPLDWTVGVFIERDWPVEGWMNAAPTLTAATAPRVNVWWESSSFDPSSSATPAAQAVFEATYVLDVMARGVTSNDPGGGHLPADREARLNCQAATRLVRNILSATENRRLQLSPSIVWAFPKFQSFEMGPAPLDDIEPNTSVWNCRCRFNVKMTEMAPEFTDYDTLNLIRIDVSDLGEVLFSTEIS